MNLSLGSTSLLISPSSLNVLTQVGPVLQVDGRNYYWTEKFSARAEQGQCTLGWNYASYFKVLSFICLQKFHMIWTFHAWLSSSFWNCFLSELDKKQFLAEKAACICILFLFLPFPFFPLLICGMLFPFMSFVFNFPLTYFLLSFASTFWFPSVFSLLFVLLCIMLSYLLLPLQFPVHPAVRVLFCTLPPADFPNAPTGTGLLSLSCVGRPAPYKSGFWLWSRHCWLFFFPSFLINMNNKKASIHPELLEMTPLKFELTLWYHCISCDQTPMAKVSWVGFAFSAQRAPNVNASLCAPDSRILEPCLSTSAGGKPSEWGSVLKLSLQPVLAEQGRCWWSWVPLLIPGS